MKTLPKHIEKIGVGVVFLACCGLLYLQIEAGQPKWVSRLGSSQGTIERALKGGKVTPNYQYSAQAAEKNLKFKDVMVANEERIDKLTVDPIPAFVAYLQPSRPRVDQVDRPKGIQTIKEAAAMGKLTDIAARGDHGCVFVTFKVPSDNKHTVNSHVEIFRGEAADKIDMNKPYGIVDLSPLEEAEPDKEKKPEKKEETGRRPRTRGDEPAAGDPKDKPVEIPADIAALQVFGDTQVEPKKTYFYKVRLIAKMTVLPDKPIEQKDNTGVARHYLVVTPPEGVQTAAPPEGGEAGAYYASEASAAISAMPPANFEFWLSGIIGEISPVGTSVSLVKHDYQGRFNLRVWVPEMNKWVNNYVSVSEGQKLTAPIKYRDAAGKAVNIEFDTGFKLVEIIWGDRPVESKGGTAKTMPTEKAVMEEIATKKREEHWKGGDAAERKGREMEALRLKMEKDRKAREASNKKRKGGKAEPKKP